MSLFKKKKVEAKSAESKEKGSLGRSFYAILEEDIECQKEAFGKLKGNVKSFAEMVASIKGEFPQTVNFDDVDDLEKLNDRFEKVLEVLKKHIFVSEHQPDKTNVVLTKNALGVIPGLIYPLGKKEKS